jgi:hypothetical protein
VQIVPPPELVLLLGVGAGGVQGEVHSTGFCCSLLLGRDGGVGRDGGFWLDKHLGSQGPEVGAAPQMWGDAIGRGVKTSTNENHICCHPGRSRGEVSSRVNRVKLLNIPQ